MKSHVWLVILLATGAFAIWRGWRILELVEEPEDLEKIRSANAAVASILHATAKNGEVVLMAATWGYLEFVTNSICRLEQLGIHHLVLLALDDETQTFFQEKGYSVIRSTMLGTRQHYGKIAQSLYSRDFNLIAREKHAGALACLSLGLKVFLLDVDVFLIKNPLDALRVASERFDFVFQSDAKLADPPNFYVNSGFYYATPSPGSIETLSRLVTGTRSGYDQEQTVLHNLVCGVNEKFATGSRSCYNPQTKCESSILDREKFVNGYVLTRDANAKRVLAWEPFTLHFNWMEGKDNKMQAMKALGMWITELGNCSHPYNVGDSRLMAQSFDASVSVE